MGQIESMGDKMDRMYLELAALRERCEADRAEIDRLRAAPAAIITCDGTAHLFARRDTALVRYAVMDGREIRFYESDDIEVIM